MTITPEQHAETLKTAISDALQDSDGSPHPDRVDAIHTAVEQVYATALPSLITDALNQSAIRDGILASMATPMLSTLEDEINDDHDDPKTPEQYRPGLRRAARLIRDTRRAAQEDR